MSMSGYATMLVDRPSLMNRSNSRSWRMGSTRVMPRAYATIEFARAPPPLRRDAPLPGEAHEVLADEEEAREMGARR